AEPLSPGLGRGGRSRRAPEHIPVARVVDLVEVLHRVRYTLRMPGPLKVGDEGLDRGHASRFTEIDLGMTAQATMRSRLTHASPSSGSSMRVTSHQSTAGTTDE